MEAIGAMEKVVGLGGQSNQSLGKVRQSQSTQKTGGKNYGLDKFQTIMMWTWHE